MHVITGATGNIGKALAEELLANDQTVRVVGRSVDRLRPLVKKGAEAFVGDAADSKAMERAFAGASSVFVLIPPHYTADNLRAFQNRMSEAYASAVRKAGVKRVVSLSSVGAHLGEKTGPVNGLYDHEQRFNAIENVDVLHLRPSFFMENMLMGVPMIKNQGIYGAAMRPDVAVSMIATRDIARVAAKRLLALDFGGKSTCELLGQRELTMREATTILGKAIGKPDLKYVQFSYEDTEKALTSMGLSPDVAKNFVELYRSSNEGIFGPTEKRSEKNTTPTSFESFAEKVLAPVYKTS